ncbi:MAG: 30S ribosomal protein S12 methylthiotransferase RimO [Lachnospiraceae bacterium]|nr:30S ribosomal protein S12 methylthiotransferase RimO [Lachnospiraceae bacterium]MCR4991743.1 30S ribosomal protein S12 methylthiotransferase RimO [Lachnospiraceae bacterium]
MKISFISLGCDKNLVDSEKMLAMMNDSGYEVTDIIADAEAVIINTCCFIHDAKQESIDTIIETAGYKKTGRLKYLIVTGCLATRYHDEISEYLPEVDAILSSSAADELDSCLKKLSGKGLESKSIIKDINRDPDLGKKRLHNNLKNYAYIKIGEGCSKHCTYCVIPSIKGEYRSFPFEDIISEARDAVEKGKNELILIAQETTVYGTDLYGRKRLSELLYALNDIEGLEWIRLMYCYPEEIDDELINAIRDIDKVCKYIDMPIQHISDSILKRMGRKTTGDDIRKLIVKLRREIPGIAIRTSLITGFPGETEEDHTELLEFIKEYRLDRVGVFTYSKEENTPAARFKPVVLKKIKEKRRKELMLAQQEIVFEENEKLYGKVLKAVAEGYLPEEKVYVARTYRDAPDVDGCCFVSSDRDIVLGTVTDVKINGAAGYDLTAEEVI